jgi:uncharacterized protein (TIGR00369 family)
MGVDNVVTAAARPDLTPRTRTYMWTPVDTSRLPLADRSGLEYFQQLRDGALPAQPISQTIGWTIEAVDRGSVRLSFVPELFLFHSGGLLHGGILATLLDSAMSTAIISTLGKGQAARTVNLSVNYIRGVTHRDGPLVVTGNVDHVGRQTGVASAAVTDSAGRLFAQGTSTCLILAAE